MSLAIQAISRVPLPGRPRLKVSLPGYASLLHFLILFLFGYIPDTDIFSSRFSWFRAIYPRVSLSENKWDCQLRVSLASWRPIHP